MRDRIETVFESETLKIEYDNNLGEVKFTVPTDVWTMEHDAVHGAVALFRYIVKGGYGPPSVGPVKE